MATSSSPPPPPPPCPPHPLSSLLPLRDIAAAVAKSRQSRPTPQQLEETEDKQPVYIVPSLEERILETRPGKSFTVYLWNRPTRKKKSNQKKQQNSSSIEGTNNKETDEPTENVDSLLIVNECIVPISIHSSVLPSDLSDLCSLLQLPSLLLAAFDSSLQISVLRVQPGTVQLYQGTMKRSSSSSSS